MKYIFFYSAPKNTVQCNNIEENVSTQLALYNFLARSSSFKQSFAELN